MLADLIREHPHLYDPTRRDYKDSTKGQRSWREIAEAMGKPEEEVKQKWKNLRDKFYKAKKRLRYVPVLYSELAWLSAYVRPRLERGAKEPDEVQTPTEIGSPDALSSIRDEDELFLLSLLPSIKRLTMKKRMEVRMKFQQVLYAAEFEDQH
uniref:MADF domain-containing protein n=1 Tax=Salarias fasciatus TaxID=181472 RepID=A0A672GQ95_SALFA